MRRLTHPSVSAPMDTRALDEPIDRACTKQRSRPTLVLGAARDYVRRGFSPVPLSLTLKSKGKDPNAGKACYLNGWPSLRITTETQIVQYFSGPVNVGAILGSVSKLVDIDLDCPEAIDLADKYLPPTNSIFGRPSKPRSHRLYQCDTVAPTQKFTTP